LKGILGNGLPGRAPRWRARRRSPRPRSDSPGGGDGGLRRAAPAEEHDPEAHEEAQVQVAEEDDLGGGDREVGGCAQPAEEPQAGIQPLARRAAKTMAPTARRTRFLGTTARTELASQRDMPKGPALKARMAAASQAW